MYQHFKNLTNVIKSKPVFKVEIEDICNKEPKELFQYMTRKDEVKKDRSNTFNGVYDFKSCLVGDKRLSSINPLSELNKFK
jgi:hypothetical protein